MNDIDICITFESHDDKKLITIKRDKFGDIFIKDHEKVDDDTLMVASFEMYDLFKEFLEKHV